MADKFMNFVGKENISNKVEMVDFAKMEQIRARAEEIVKRSKRRRIFKALLSTVL